MSIEMNFRQLKYEADRDERNDCRQNIPGFVSRKERIAPLSTGSYEPPPFLAKTATVEEYREIAQILQSIRAWNQDHTGMYCKELEAYIASTGQDRELIDRLYAWCRPYFGHRLLKTSRRDRNKLDTFHRLFREYRDIVGSYGDILNTINYMFLTNCSGFMRDYLFEETISKHYDLDESGRYYVLDIFDNKLRPIRCFVRNPIIQAPRLEAFLQVLSKGLPDSDRKRLQAMNSSQLTDHLESLMESIHTMRPVLVKGFNERKTISSFGDECLIAWCWIINPGIAALIVGRNEREIWNLIKQRTTSFPVRVRFDGLLLDALFPWITTHNIDPIDGISALALNVYLIERFHTRLCEFYSKINFSRLLATVTKREANETAVALAYHQLANERDQETDFLTRFGREIVPTLRLKPLLRLLHGKLNCEIRSGKGSEITVYRSGGRKFILGQHKSNPEVRWTTLRRLLGRVGITPREWGSAVFCEKADHVEQLR